MMIMMMMMTHNKKITIIIMNMMTMITMLMMRVMTMTMVMKRRYISISCFFCCASMIFTVIKTRFGLVYITITTCTKRKHGHNKTADAGFRVVGAAA